MSRRRLLLVAIPVVLTLAGGGAWSLWPTPPSLDGNDTQQLKAIAPEDFADNFQAHSARLSPDGRRLAFGKAVVRNADGVVAVVPPDKLYVRDVNRTHADTVVAELPGTQMLNWVWSPDGTKLAIAALGGEHFTRTWVADLKTKKLHEVTMPRFKVKDREYPMNVEAWSPDGKSFLAYGNGLFLVKTDGTGARRLTKAGINHMLGTCRFSPDGRKVLFVAIADK